MSITKTAQRRDKPVHCMVYRLVIIILSLLTRGDSSRCTPMGASGSRPHGVVFNL